MNQVECFLCMFSQEACGKGADIQIDEGSSAENLSPFPKLHNHFEVDAGNL